MFDDGRADNYTTAIPAVQAAGLKATIYTVPTWFDTDGYITTAQAQELDAAGVDIANHTNTHPHLTNLTDAEQAAEFTAAKNTLDAAGMTRASAHVAYPYTQSNSSGVAAMAAAGMLTGRAGGSQDYYEFMSYLNVYDGLGLYNLRLVIYPPDIGLTVASIKTKLDYIKAHGEIGALLFHSVGGDPEDPYNYPLADFQEILAYINQLGIESLTISEWYQRYLTAYPDASPLAAHDPAQTLYIEGS